MNIIKGIPPILDGQTDVSIDIEMFGQEKAKLHRPHGTFACISLGVEDSVYVVTERSALKEVFHQIKDAKHHIYHNAMYDIRQLSAMVEMNERPVWDTMLVEKVLWGGYFGIAEFSLQDLVRRYLGVYMTKDPREEFSTRSYMTDEMVEYAAKDAYYTLKVKMAQEKEIDDRSYDMKAYWEVDAPAMWVFLNFLPVKIDVSRWLSMADEFVKRGEELENELGFNVNSAKQISEKFKYAKFPRTDKGNPKTDEDALLSLRGRIPADIVDKILLARQYRKASSTYGEDWVKNFAEDDGLVYADFHVTGTETGRPSCSSPNLLNIPARKIPEYRELFIPDRGKLLISDISAQEPACLAYLSRDQNLINIFKEGRDVHLEVARAIYNDPTLTKQKDADKRAVGKIVNLGTSYGMSAKGISEEVGISVEEAEKFLYNYFRKFPMVQLYIDGQRSKAYSMGFVYTVVGRRIWINPYSDQWSRNAINAPIQGSAAEFTKKWLVKFRDGCCSNGLTFPVCNVVYDELVCDIETGLEDRYRTLQDETFADISEELFPGVPIKVETQSGSNWGCKK